MLYEQPQQERLPVRASISGYKEEFIEINLPVYRPWIALGADVFGFFVTIIVGILGFFVGFLLSVSIIVTVEGIFNLPDLSQSSLATVVFFFAVACTFAMNPLLKRLWLRLRHR